MDIETRNELDNIYRNIVNKREAVETILSSLDEDIFNLEAILYTLHEEGWNPSDLFYED